MPFAVTAKHVAQYVMRTVIWVHQLEQQVMADWHAIIQAHELGRN